MSRMQPETARRIALSMMLASAITALTAVCVLLVAALPALAQQPPPAAQVFDQAKAYGAATAQQAGANVRNGQSENALRNIVPGYTDNPPERSLYNSKNFSGATANLQAQCAMNPADAKCAGIRIGVTPRPATDLSVASPAMASLPVVRNPTSVLGDIAQTYNACAVGGGVTSPDVYQRRSCSIDTGAWADNVCSKRLSVKPVDTYTCTPDSVLASRVIVRGGADRMHVQALCKPMINPLIRLQLDAQGGRGSCSPPLDLTIDMPWTVPKPGVNPEPTPLGTLQPHWGGGCSPLETYWTGEGCSGARCNFQVHFIQGPGIKRTYTCPEPEQRTGNLIGFDVFQPPQDSERRCYAPFPAEDDALGKPGGWGAADGVIAFWAEVGTGRQTGWEWGPGEHYTADMAFEPPRFSPASGDTWTNACSSWEAQTARLLPDGKNSATQVAIPVATAIGQPQCVRTKSVCTDGPSTYVIDGVPVTRECWSYQNTFACTALAAPSTCTDPGFAACSPVGAAACMQTDGRGHCIRSELAYDCKTASAVTTPALNCGGAAFCAGGSCWDTTSVPSGEFAIAVTQLEAHQQAAKDMEFDGENVQIFKGQDKRCHNDIFGLDRCCNNQALIGQCSADERDLDVKRKQGRCHEVGEYCSASTFGICREKTKTFCCFSSLLARLIQEQGRGQIAKPWGDPKTPVCKGFSAAELSAMDWSQFDLSEFYASINATPLPQGVATGNVQNKQRSCYFGEGRC